MAAEHFPGLRHMMFRTDGHCATFSVIVLRLSALEREAWNVQFCKSIALVMMDQALNHQLAIVAVVTAFSLASDP